jgi:hypothetical protein
VLFYSADLVLNDFAPLEIGFNQFLSFGHFLSGDIRVGGLFETLLDPVLYSFLNPQVKNVRSKIE